MSKLPTATLPPVSDIEPTPHIQAGLETASPLGDVEVQPAPTLITEEEVIFSTAAVVRPPSTRWAKRATHVVAVAMRRIFTVENPRPKRRHYPPRLDFVEDLRMAREMERL